MKFLVLGLGASFALLAAAACSGDSNDPPTGGDGGVLENGDGGGGGDAAHDGDAAASNVVWPNDATKLVAKNAGGGLIAPSPDAGCTIGAATYTVTPSTKQLEYTRCVRPDSGPYAPMSGSRTLADAELTALVTTLKAVKIAGNDPACGADKPVLTLTVTDPRGEHSYTDSFYACRKDTATTYVDDIDPVFSKLAALVGDNTL